MPILAEIQSIHILLGFAFLFLYMPLLVILKPAHTVTLVLFTTFFWPRAVIPNVPIVGIHGDDILIFVVFCLIAARCAKERLLWGMGPIAKGLIFWSILGVVGLVVGIMTNSISVPLVEAVKLEIKPLRAILLSAMIYWACRNQKDVLHVFDWFLLLLTLTFVCVILSNSGVALMDIFTPSHVQDKLYYAEGGTERYSAMYTGPWVVGSVGIAAASFAIVLLNLHRKKTAIICAATLLTSLVAILKCQSRAGLICYGFMLGLALFFSKIKRKMLIGTVAGLLVLYFLTYGYAMVESRLAKLGQNLHSGAFAERLYFTREGLAEAPLMSYITGVGYGGLQVNVHNFFVAFFLATGIPGLLFMCWAFIAIMRFLSRAKQIEKIASLTFSELKFRNGLTICLMSLGLFMMSSGLPIATREALIVFATLTLIWYQMAEQQYYEDCEAIYCGDPL